MVVVVVIVLVVTVIIIIIVLAVVIVVLYSHEGAANIWDTLPLGKHRYERVSNPFPEGLTRSVLTKQVSSYCIKNDAQQ